MRSASPSQKGCDTLFAQSIPANWVCQRQKLLFLNDLEPVQESFHVGLIVGE